MKLSNIPILFYSVVYSGKWGDIRNTVNDVYAYLSNAATYPSANNKDGWYFNPNVDLNQVGDVGFCLGLFSDRVLEWWHDYTSTYEPYKIGVVYDNTTNGYSMGCENKGPYLFQLYN